MVSAAIVLALLTSCDSDRAVNESLTETSPPPFAGTGEPQTTDIPYPQSSQEVLNACDTSLQAKALRREMIPEWSGLGMNTCYDMTFDLTSGGKNYSGSSKITFTNPGSASLKDIMLRLFPNSPAIFGGSLELTSALANGEDLTAQIIYDDTTTIRLPLETPLEPGATVVLDLNFKGQTPVDFESELIYGTFHFSTEGQILLLSNAYPMLALLENGQWLSAPVTSGGDPVTSPTALYRVQVRIPPGWEVAASGSQTSWKEDGGQIILGYAGGPLRDFMLAASPSFEMDVIEWEDITIHLWGLPGTEANWDATLEIARNSLELFDQTFGKLPYNEVDIVIAPLQNASGVEYPGLFLLGLKLYVDEESNYLIQLVTAHELSHQWWYSAVGNDVLNHPYLDEALATYSGLFSEKEFDPRYYESMLSYYQQRVDTYEAANGEQAVDQPVTAFEGDLKGYSIVIYNKGGLFFAALRNEIGETAFDSALNRYYEVNLYRIARPNDLLDSFETVCMCSLDEFYAEWGVTP